MRTLSSSSNLWGYEDWWHLREKLIVQMIVILINRHCLLLGPLSVSPISLETHFDIWLSSHLNASKSPFLQSCQDLPRFTKHHASCQIITLAPDRQKQRTLSPISPGKTKLIVCIDQSVWPSCPNRKNGLITFRQKFMIFSTWRCHCVALLEAFLGPYLQCLIGFCWLARKRNQDSAHLYTDPGHSRDRVLHEILA